MKILKRILTFFNKKHLLIIYGIVLFIHFVIKDRVYPINIIFYACPLFILIIGNLLLCILYFKIKRVFYLLTACLVFLTFFWFTNYYNVSSISESLDGKESILFWNIARKDKEPLEVLVKEIKNFEPSMIALVEAGELDHRYITAFRKSHPHYSIRILEGEMLLAVKGDIKTVKYYAIEDSYKFNFVEVTIAGQKKSILIADVNAVPFNNRKLALAAIHEFISKKNPSFVVGDFNTPYESLYFADFRSALHDFHSVSDGFTTTWPFGIPFTEIDQIWSAKEIKPLQLYKEYYTASDHALLIGIYH